MSRSLCCAQVLGASSRPSAASFLFCWPGSAWWAHGWCFPALLPADGWRGVLRPAPAPCPRLRSLFLSCFQGRRVVCGFALWYAGASLLQLWGTCSGYCAVISQHTCRVVAHVAVTYTRVCRQSERLFHSSSPFAGCAMTLTAALSCWSLIGTGQARAQAQGARKEAPRPSRVSTYWPLSALLAPWSLAERGPCLPRSSDSCRTPTTPCAPNLAWASPSGWAPHATLEPWRGPLQASGALRPHRSPPLLPAGCLLRSRDQDALPGARPAPCPPALWVGRLRPAGTKSALSHKAFPEAHHEPGLVQARTGEFPSPRSFIPVGPGEEQTSCPVHSGQSASGARAEPWGRATQVHMGSQEPGTEVVLS